MKVRVNRRGLLGIVVHEKGEELDIERDQWRVWMDPLDDEAKEVKSKWEASQKDVRLERAKRELLQMNQRVAQMEADLASKDKQGVKEDVL